MSQSDLASKAVAGIGWTTVDKWGKTGISLVVFVLLARLLDPVAFGLVALANVYLAFCALFSEQGFSAAIIQREDLTSEHLDTAFWTSLAIGVLLVLATLLLAGPVSAMLGEPRLRPIILVLSVNLVAGALSSVQIAILKKEFRFRVLAMRNVLATTAGGMVGVAMALTGFGVWSLVAMSLTTAVVAAIVLWSKAEWRPRFCFSLERHRELFRFGSSVVGTNFVKFAGKNADRVIIGLFLSTEALGIYKIAYNLVHQISSAMSSVYSVVALPLFSRLQSDHLRLNAVFSRMTRFSLITAAPVFAIVGIYADPLVSIIFGEQWLDSAGLLRILALLGVLHAVTHFHQPMLYALGRPGSYLVLNVSLTACRLLLLLLAAPFGLAAVAAAVVVVSYLQWPITLGVISRFSGLDLRRYASSFVHALIPTLFMSAALIATIAIDPAARAPSAVLLAIAIAGLLNAGILWLVERDLVLTVYRLVRRRGSLEPA